MNQKLTLQQIIPVTEARNNLSKLVEEAEEDKWFFFTKGGKPKVVLVGVDLWVKINQELEKFIQKTFISPETLPFTRVFSDKEIKRWLKEDQLIPRQKKIITQSEEA